MSWTLDCDIPAGTTYMEAVGLLDDAQPSGNEDCLQEREKAVFAARSAVCSMLGSGVTGYLKMEGCAGVGAQVRINGHCNPGNAPREGWADDWINIHIFQL